MFDIGFAELVLLMLVGLLVLGPERLPRVARDIGLYMRKARRAWNQMRLSIERELDASEMRSALEETREQARSVVDDIKQQTDLNPTPPTAEKADQDND